MPLFGLLDTQTALADAVDVQALFCAADEFQVESADVLTLTYEIDIEEGQKAVPKALHPSVPSYAQIVVRQLRDGPWGACTMAELRINARAATNYLGYCVGAIVDGDVCLRALRERYGVRAVAGSVRLERRYYGVFASAVVDGHVCLDAEVTGLLPINGQDVLFTPNLHLARIAGVPRLIHQEMQYTIRSAQRGTTKLKTLKTDSFGEGRVRIGRPLPPTLVTADVRFMAVSYLVDPDQPALVGTVAL